MTALELYTAAFDFAKSCFQEMTEFDLESKMIEGCKQAGVSPVDYPLWKKTVQNFRSAFAQVSKAKLPSELSEKGPSK